MISMDGPLKWATPAGYTPDIVRSAGNTVWYSAREVAVMLDAADAEHSRRIRTENARGGEARGVVADVARALGVDIDAGPGHRWDPDHMRRVVAAAERLIRERDDARHESAGLSELLRVAREHRDAWKKAMEETDTKHVIPLRRQLREEREKNEALVAEKRAAQAAARREPPYFVLHTTAADEQRTAWLGAAQVTSGSSDVDELKAVIVSQAREIARLKGESE